MTRVAGRPSFTVGDRALAVDAGTIVVVSVAICVASDRLLVMQLVVAAALCARFALFARLPVGERGLAMAVEVPFFALCTALGAFNDWNSVVRHRVYDYTVPSELPALTTIPVWMLVFWGMILRFFVTLARARRIGAGPEVSDDVGLGRARTQSGALKVALQLALVLATRQAIYWLHGDPILSWLPFAAALALYLLVLAPSRTELWLIALAVTVGPLVESAYITFGHLHRYELGWLGGVPLWIALWWGLAVPIWGDLAARLLSLASGQAATPGSPEAFDSASRRT